MPHANQSSSLSSHTNIVVLPFNFFSSLHLCPFLLKTSKNSCKVKEVSWVKILGFEILDTVNFSLI